MQHIVCLLKLNLPFKNTPRLDLSKYNGNAYMYSVLPDEIMVGVCLPVDSSLHVCEGCVCPGRRRSIHRWSLRPRNCNRKGLSSQAIVFNVKFISPHPPLSPIPRNKFKMSRKQQTLKNLNLILLYEQ